MSPALAHPWPPGTRIRRRGDGAVGRVVHALGHNTETGVCGYFVVWDDQPGVRAYVTSERIEPA